MSEDKKLPPDPDGINDSRSLWAQTAIDRFRHETGTDPEDALSDLLCDLMHWADRNGMDFGKELERGRGHYKDETMEAPIFGEIGDVT